MGGLRRSGVGAQRNLLQADMLSKMHHMRHEHLQTHPLLMAAAAPASGASSDAEVKDALARMHASVNSNARAGSNSGDPNAPQVGWLEHVPITGAGSGVAPSAPKGPETDEHFLAEEEEEIKEEAEVAVEQATEGTVHLNHDMSERGGIAVTEKERSRWAVMDTRALRVELVHVATERNKAAAAVGKIAKNCSEELEELYFKLKKKVASRNELRDDMQNLKKEKEKLQEEHKALKEHAGDVVLKHMKEKGVDVEFIKPHHMDTDTLLKAARKASELKEEAEFRKMMKEKKEKHIEPTVEEIYKTGNTKRLERQIQRLEFTSLPADVLDGTVRKKKKKKDDDDDDDKKHKHKDKDKEKKDKHKDKHHKRL